MPVWAESDDCPRCARSTLQRETWVSTQDFREECSACGYFREATYGYRVAMDLGLAEAGLNISDLDQLLAALEERHFCTETYPCVREGVIHKTAANADQCQVIGTWFQSPSELEDIGVDWLHAQPPGEPTLSHAEKSALQDVIGSIVGEVRSGGSVNDVHIHERLPIHQDEKPPIGVMLVTDSPETGDAGLKGRLERSLAQQFGRPVFVVNRRSSRQTETKDEAS